MKFIDLKSQYEQIKDKVNIEIANVLEQGDYIMGEQVKTLEERLEKYTSSKHCLTCSSGTDALLMCLIAIGAGAGDAVFTTSFSFFATAEVISLCGATPIFVDINPDSFNIDPYCLRYAIKRVIAQTNLKPKAVIAVDIFGSPCDHIQLDEICQQYGVSYIVDAAQSFGSSQNGIKTGCFGRFTTTSFFPSKPLGCYGDGGAVFCASDSDAELIDSIRVHGKGKDKYDNVRIGLNARLDTIQAAVLHCKLDSFDYELELRKKIAGIYNKMLGQAVKLQKLLPNSESAYALFTIELKNSEERETVRQALLDNNIPSAIYYSMPLNKQKAFGHLSHSIMPNAEHLSETCLSLPMHPYLKEDDAKTVCQVILNSINS